MFGKEAPKAEKTAEPTGADLWAGLENLLISAAGEFCAYH